MKPWILCVAAISLCVHSSCSNNEFNDVSPPTIDTKVCGIVYPLKMKSRSLSSFENDWENQTSIELNSGVNRNLPWVTSDANLPIDFVRDIKKEDGWILLFHTFLGNSIIGEERTNYMVFYNQRTSFLKIFYYLENSSPNNTGIWKMNLNVDNQFFNHINDLSIPQNHNYLKYITSSTASNSVENGFKEGWNGFQIQLAFDTSNNTEGTVLDISASNANVANIDLYGDFNSLSTGTLISHGSSNPIDKLANKIATAFGSEAENWLSNTLGLGNKIGSIGKKIVQKGINKLLGKVTAGYSQTTTLTDLSFTTQTNGTYTGHITLPLSSDIKSLRAPFSTSDLGMNIGVWNLASTPTIYLHPLADKTSDYFNGKEFNYMMRGITGYNYDLRINPDLQPYLINHWVDINVVRYINKGDSVLLNPITNFDYGTLGDKNYGVLSNHNRPLNYIYNGDENGNNKIVEEDMKSVVYAREGLYERYGQSPTVISVPNEAMYIAGDLKYQMKDTYLKFSLFLVTEFEGKRDTTLHTRTFVPKVEWDPVLYNQYSNYSQHEVLPKLEIMKEDDNDSFLQVK